jgi:hypothetical protein
MSKQLTYGKAVLRLTGLTVGIALLALILFYTIYYADCGADRGYTLEEALYAAIDYAGTRGEVSEDEMMTYLASLGWPEERLEDTLDRISQDDPDLMLRLFTGLEEYAQSRYGCSVEDLVQ